MSTITTEKSSNSELVMELIGILQKEASLFETFLELLEEQQQAIVQNDLKRLKTNTEIQQQKTFEESSLAARREEIIRELSRLNGNDEDLTISRLIDSVTSGQAARLEQLKQIILELHGKIGRMRSQNQFLINRSRDNITKTLELIQRIKAPEKRYQKEGRIKKDNGVSLALDRRA
jgi:hypothetical protein